MAEPRVIVEQVEEPWPELEIKSLDGTQDPGVEPWQIVSKDGDQEQDIKHNNKKYQCDICQSWLSRKSHLDRHMLFKHTQENNFKCDFCDKVFKQKSDLTRHERVHIGQDYKSCNVCDKFFTSQTRLNMHMKIHTGIGLFDCNICKQSFPERRQLKNHYIKEHMKHTPCKERPLQCDVCQKTFKSSQRLTWHKQFHSDELRHKCKLCDERFVSLYYLNIHRSRVHKGIESFTCNICKKSFDFKRGLKRHMKRVHNVINDSDKDISTKEKSLERKIELKDEDSGDDCGLYKCTLCNQRFKNSRKIKRHMFTHTGVMPFQCNTCDKSYLFPYELRKHRKRSHNIEDCPTKTKVESKSKRKYEERDDDIMENDFAIDMNVSSNIDQENSNDSFEKIKSTKKRKLDEIETGEMSFKCNLCNKLYLLPYELREHKKDYHRVEDDSLEDDLSNIDVVIQLPSNHEEIEDFKDELNENDEGLQNFDEKSRRLDDKSRRLDDKSRSLDDKSDALNVKSNSFDKKSNVFDKKSNGFDKRLDSFDAISNTNNKKSDIIDSELNLDDDTSKHYDETYDLDDDNSSLTEEKSFKSTKHLTGVTKNNDRKCGVCGETFKGSRALKRHRMVHTGVAPFNCDICDYKCMFNADLERHTKSKNHLKKVQLMQKKDNKNKADPTSNDKTNQDTIRNDNDIVDNPCDSVDRFNNSLHDEQSYDETIDNNEFEEATDQALNHEENKDQSLKISKTCIICGEQFKGNKDFEIHKVLHTGKFPYNCNVCNQNCVFKADFEKHKKSKKHLKRLLLNGKKDQTNLMEDSNIDNSETVTNVNDISSEGDKLLNDSFIEPSTGVRSKAEEQILNQNNNESLADPLDISSFDKDKKGKRKCNVCKELFENSRKLRMHRILHTGKMPFPCDLCTKSYLYPYELRNHKTSIHFKEEKTAEKKTTEKKRVKCDRVVKKKGRRMQLYRCKLCPQQFTTSRKIRVHMTSHTGNKPFPCDVCNKSYLFPYELRRHKIRAHNIDQEIMDDSIGKNDGVNDEISMHDDNGINDDDNDFTDDDNDNRHDFNDDNGYVDNSISFGQTATEIYENKKDTRSLKKGPEIFIKDKSVSSAEVFTISITKLNQVKNKNTKDLTKKDNRKSKCGVCGKIFSFKVDLEIHQTIVKACNTNPISLDVEFSIKDVTVYDGGNGTNEESDIFYTNSTKMDVYSVHGIESNCNIDLEEHDFIPAHEIVKVENAIFENEMNGPN